MIKMQNKAEIIKISSVCITLALLIQGFTLNQKFLVTDDIAQHHIWLDTYSANGFLADDPWITASKVIQPYVISLILRSAHFVAPTLVVGKILALATFALTGVLVFLLGSEIGKRTTGWIALSIFCVSDAWIGISGGFARSFAWPIVALFLLASLRRNNPLIAFSLFASAALYPIVFVLLFPAWFLMIVHDYHSDRRVWSAFPASFLREQCTCILAILFGVSLVLSKSHELGNHPLVGPQVTFGELQTDPLFCPEGRWPLWPQPDLMASLNWSLLPWGKSLVEPMMRHLDGQFLNKFVGLLTSVLPMGIPLFALYSLCKRNGRNGFILTGLLFAGICTFFLARIFLPRLYEPTKYLIWSMPLLAVLSWALFFDWFVDKIKHPGTRLVVLISICFAALSRFPSIQGKGAEDVSEYAKLYARLSETPKGALIATFPRTSDFIPIFCGRSIFVSHESSHAVLFSRYKELVVSRQELFVDAFYSNKIDRIKSLINDHSVDWFVVEDKYYSKKMPQGVHFAPYEQVIRRLLDEDTDPYLHQLALKYGERVQDGVYLLDAKLCFQKLEQSKF